MLQEGLEHDQVQWIKCVIKQQLDTEKKKTKRNYPVSRENHLADRR